MSVVLVALFFVVFTLYKFDAFTGRLFDTFLGTVSADYINIQWFIAWDLKHFFSGFSGYWSPPFYAPLPLSAGFGDHILGQSALLILPYALTGNTVFCYNFLFLATFILTGIAAYLLFHQLTLNKTASLIMAVAFNYAHFRMSLLAHLYVLAIYPLIFFFVFGHRFIDNRRPVDFALAYACLIWQVLSGLNMGIFAFYISFGFFLFYFLTEPSLRTRAFATRVLAGHALTGLIFIWIAWPNMLALRAQDLAWRWGDSVRHSTNWGTLISLPLTNLWSGDWMKKFFVDVDTVQAFPGVLVLLAAGVAVWFWKVPRTLAPVKPWSKLASGGLGALAAAYAVAGVAVFFISTSLSIEKKIELSGWSVVLAVAALALNERTRTFCVGVYRAMPVRARFFALLTIVALLFSFPQFYRALNIFAPGFKNVRVPIRLLEIFELGLCALGAYGVASLLSQAGTRVRQTWVAAGCIALLCVENIHPVIPTEKAPDLPAAHVWLMKQPAVTGLVELPFPPTVMTYKRHKDYVYWTTFHWLPTVHGYSSFFPKHYQWLSLALRQNPVPPLEYLQALRVSHVICHWKRFEPGEAEKVRVELNRRLGTPVYDDPSVTIYPLAPASFEIPTFLPLPAETTVKASIKEKYAQRMIDGKIRTVWKTGRPQQAGDAVEFTFPAEVKSAGVALELGAQSLDFPRAFTVEGKINGRWVALGKHLTTFPSGADFVSVVNSPSHPRFTVRWPTASCSALRLTLIQPAVENHWSIAEVSLLAPN